MPTVQLEIFCSPKCTYRRDYYWLSGHLMNFLEFWYLKLSPRLFFIQDCGLTWHNIGLCLFNVHFMMNVENIHTEPVMSCKTLDILNCNSLCIGDEKRKSMNKIEARSVHWNAHVISIIVKYIGFSKISWSSIKHSCNFSTNHGLFLWENNLQKLKFPNC